MRKILIDTTLEKNVDEFYDNLFKKRNSNFVKPIDGLKKIYNGLGPREHKKHREYIDTIIKNYAEIIKATPSQIEKLITKFNKIDTGEILNQKINKNKLKFYEQIINAMRYEDLRNSEFHSFIKASGIKSCVYCNAQLTVVINFSFYDKKEKKRKPKNMAKLELDHYHAKSTYPFLSTSFYNLYPVCGNCNRAKSYNKIDFELYTNNAATIDPFKFWIDDQSILDYWLSIDNDRSNLNVHFESTDGDFKLLNEYNKMFAIQGIYDTQIDIAEELVHKAKVYTDAYKKTLVNNFKTLFPDNLILERLIVGNYTNPSEVHKRPMAKYSQDIARQLGLIK